MEKDKEEIYYVDNDGNVILYDEGGMSYIITHPYSMIYRCYRAMGFNEEKTLKKIKKITEKVLKIKEV